MALICPLAPTPSGSRTKRIASATRVSQALPGLARRDDAGGELWPRRGQPVGRQANPSRHLRHQTVDAAIVSSRSGAQVALNGFKRVFVMNGHGAPTHSIALNEACDFVSETYDVTMLHLTGLFRADAAIQSNGERINARYFPPQSLLRDGRSCRRQRNLGDSRHPARFGSL